MLLLEFGMRDIMAVDADSFEVLVALREMTHILLKQSNASVLIRKLDVPLPDTQANYQLRKGITECYKPVLPSGFVLHENERGDLSITMEPKDAYHVIINGPRAPAPD